MAETFRILHLIQPNPDNKCIDIEEIRKACANGLSECPPEDRCMAWIALLDVYPKNPNEWPDVKKEIIDSYNLFKKDFGVDDWHNRRFKPNIQKAEFKLNSVEDNHKMAVIHGDIVRTGRHIFFLPPDDPQAPCEAEVLAPFVVHMRRLERILFIFASVNPSLSYMQGFNELLPPLYFTVTQAMALFEDDMDIVEAISFKLFQQLINFTSINELYTTADQSSLIMRKLSDFEAILSKQLPEFHQITKNLNLTPILYCYRWFNLLFAQEHELPVLLIIWDSLFAHAEDLLEFAFYVGVAHIKANENKIDKDSFADSIQSLQNIKVSNICTVLKDANEMYASARVKPPEGFFERLKSGLSKM